jgi:hypothetical protein
LHALWNGSASVGDGSVFLGVYAFIMVPLFLAMIAIVVWQRRREQRIVVEQLPGFAKAGWIAPSEITLLGSIAGRRGWRAAVRRRSGKKVAKAVTDYQAAVTDLAFLRARMARGSIGETGQFWHEEALGQLARSRIEAVGHPEALTMALRHHSPSSWTPPPPGPPPAPAGPQHGFRPPQPAPRAPGPPPPSAQFGRQPAGPQHSSQRRGSPMEGRHRPPASPAPPRPGESPDLEATQHLAPPPRRGPADPPRSPHP